MKNLFIGLGVLALLGATSCKKDHTCECKQAGEVVFSQTINDTKKKAEEACEEGLETSITVNGQTTTTTTPCELK